MGDDDEDVVDGIQLLDLLDRFPRIVVMRECKLGRRQEGLARAFLRLDLLQQSSGTGRSKPGDWRWRYGRGQGEVLCRPE